MLLRCGVMEKFKTNVSFKRKKNDDGGYGKEENCLDSSGATDLQFKNRRKDRKICGGKDLL